MIAIISIFKTKQLELALQILKVVLINVNIAHHLNIFLSVNAKMVLPLSIIHKNALILLWPTLIVILLN